MEGGENIFLREELEKRQGKGFNFSALELVGTRDSQQDCVKWIETDDKKFAVGMADGHGKDGAEVSNLVVEIANAELKKLPEDFKFTKKYFSDLFDRIDEQVRGKYENGGTTFLLSLIDEDNLWIAYVGDTQLYIGAKDGSIRRLTVPHRYKENKKEQDRLDFLDGGLLISDNGRSYLNITRSIGDKDFSLVSHMPEVQKVELTDEVKYIVAGTDGFWDVLNKSSKRQKKLRKILQDGGSPEEIISKINIEILSNVKLLDNATLFLLEFREKAKENVFHPNE